MIRIGYSPAAFDLFHIGSLSLLRRAKENCDYLVAGVVADEVLMEHKGVPPVIPLPMPLRGAVLEYSRAGVIR
jgi:glycerol-3-phosphate cytidylyltransferase